MGTNSAAILPSLATFWLTVMVLCRHDDTTPSFHLSYSLIFLLLLLLLTASLTMMIRLSKLLVLFVVGVGISEGSRMNLRNSRETEEQEAATYPIKLEDPAAKGGLRKLGDNTCWHGGQAQDDLTWLVRSCCNSLVVEHGSLFVTTHT